jgi:hypothetical protein
MIGWISGSVVVVGGLAAGMVATVAIATLLWDRATARAVGRLTGLAHAPGGPAAVMFWRDQLAGLPAPVVRYFDYALTPGQPLVRGARLRQTGEFAVRAGQWVPFTAVQHFAVKPPGFVWDASMRMSPLLSVRVRDSYVGGEGAMLGKLAGLAPVVDQRGTPKMAMGTLVRYLAEAAWLPPALLPGAGVRWQAVGDSTARATLTDGATTVSLDLHFGVQGEIVRVSTDRYRDVNGKPVLTPWVGYFRNYQRVDGMMVPMVGEVEWVLPEGRLPYWRGRIVAAEYDFAP